MGMSRIDLAVGSCGWKGDDHSDTSQEGYPHFGEIAHGTNTPVLSQVVSRFTFFCQDHTFVSGAADNIKKWNCREGVFLRNLSGHNAVVNSLAINQDGVLVSSADNGSMHFWDYDTGHCFQKELTKVQPGERALNHQNRAMTCTLHV